MPRPMLGGQRETATKAEAKVRAKVTRINITLSPPTGERNFYQTWATCENIRTDFLKGKITPAGMKTQETSEFEKNKKLF